VHGLTFLSDITEKLNKLNLKLQEKNKSLAEIVSDLNDFKGKLTFFEVQLTTGNLK